jgi:hypothetical protein
MQVQNYEKSVGPLVAAWERRWLSKCVLTMSMMTRRQGAVKHVMHEFHAGKDHAVHGRLQHSKPDN